MEFITLEEAIWLLKEFMQKQRRGYIKFSSDGKKIVNCEENLQGKSIKEYKRG